jgi:hypothetical protein
MDKEGSRKISNIKCKDLKVFGLKILSIKLDRCKWPEGKHLGARREQNTNFTCLGIRGGIK